MSNRGIVISPRFDFDGELLSVRGGLDPHSLRHYLLFWDKIDCPGNNVVHIGVGEETPDIQLLIREGIFARTRIQFRTFSDNIGYALLASQVAAFQLHNQQEPGTWSLGQPGSRLFLPPDISHESRMFEVELYKAIPVPDVSVSVKDVLRFKEKRQSELQRFRAAMDDLYTEVIHSNDIPRAKVHALDKLEQSIADLHRVCNESWPRKLLSTLKVELNAPSLISGAALGGTAGIALGFPPQIAAVIGAAAAAIKMDFRPVTRPNSLPTELRDYAYLHHIETELK